LKWGLVLPDWLGGLLVALVKYFCELGLLPRAGGRLLEDELELAVRWCPLDDLMASTLLINISRIIFLYF